MSGPKQLFIEPSKGLTYNRPGVWAVYEYDTYPRGSVLQGQTRRRFITDSPNVEELQVKFPKAVVTQHSNYQPPDLSHLPDDDDDYYSSW